MADTLTSTEVARHFAEYLNRVAYRRESFVVVRGRKRIAELRPVPEGRRLRDLPALLAALPRLTPDEASEFARDVDAARESLARLEVRDAWES